MQTPQNIFFNTFDTKHFRMQGSYCYTSLQNGLPSLFYVNKHGIFCFKSFLSIWQKKILSRYDLNFIQRWLTKVFVMHVYQSAACENIFITDKIFRV